MNLANKIWAIIWGLTLFALVIFSFVQSWPLEKVKDWLAVGSVIVLLVQHLYHHWSWLNLWVQKTLLWVFNSTTYWSLDVQLTLANAELLPDEVSRSIEDAVFRRYSTRVRFDRRSECDLELQIEHQFTMQIGIVDVNERAVLQLQVLDLAVGFRDSLHRIRDQLCPFFECVETVFELEQDKKYGLIAHFRGDNPYLGVFFQKLKISNVDNFLLTMKPDSAENRISITQDGVSLASRSLQTFRNNVEQIFCLTSGAR